MSTCSTRCAQKTRPEKYGSLMMSSSGADALIMKPVKIEICGGEIIMDHDG
jgi:hypothetical protein